MNMSDGPLFPSSREALTFAANYKSAAIKTPAMYRMLVEMQKADKEAQQEDGKAKRKPTNTLVTYSAMDKAGQSGFLLQVVGRLPDAAVHHMMAAVLKPRDVCSCRQPCCQGWRNNGEFIDALRLVDADLYEWLEAQKTPGKKTVYTLTPALRVEIVRQFFDRESKQSQEGLAIRFGLSEATIAAHQKKIGKHLTGVIRSAFTQLDDVLTTAGIVGALE